MTGKLPVLNSRYRSKMQKAMKKTMLLLSAVAVAAAALVSCQKEQDNSVPEKPQGIPFEITAGTVDTKTVNDDVHTTWIAGDQINLFHAEKDTDSYVSDGTFTAAADGASVAFTGTLGAALDGEKSYDWYALYPYENDYATTPAMFDYVYIADRNNSYTQTQVGNDSKAHLAGDGYPLWGKKTNVAAATKPSINLNQMTAVIAVNVTNKIEDAITVSKVEFWTSADSYLVGEFRANFAGASPVLEHSSGSGIATLNVSGASALAKDASGVYYFAVKPFDAPAGSSLSIRVTTSEGVQTSENIVPVLYNFNAGKIYTLNFNYTGKNVNLAEFKYNDSAWLTAQGIALPASGSDTNLNGAAQTVDVIEVTSTDGGTKTRVHNTSGAYDLRVYSGGSLTIAASSDNYISKITMTGKNITNLGLATANTWTGKQVSVTLPATGTANINTINVFYQAAEGSDHLLEVPTTAYDVAYNATSQGITFYKANVSDMVVSSSSPGYTSNLVSGNTITVNFSANGSTSPRDIVVNVSSASAGFDEDITITQAGAPATISTLTSGTLSTVTAKVSALTTNGFVIADNTGAIFVYKSGQGVSIGQTVTVSGTVAAYNKGLQFPSSSTVDKGATGSYSYGAAAPYTSTEIAAWTGDTNDRLASYVTMTGVVKKNGGNYDLIVGGGATANATLYYPVAAHTTGLAEGDNITVTGYATNVMSSKCGIIPTEVVNNETTPKILFEDITGVDAAGVTDATLTVTPYRIDGWTPSVSRTGCVSAASINAACTTVTYSVSNNDLSTAQAGTIVVTFQKGGESDVVYTINVAQLGKASGTSYVYTFTNKSWAATLGSSTADWTSGKDGNGFTSGQGIQVTTTTTGANATSPKSFTGVSRIVVTYNTNKSAGEGSVVVKVGTNTDKSNNCAYVSGDGRSANYTSTYDYATKQNGNVIITVNTTTNSLWIKSIEIIADSIAE